MITLNDVLFFDKNSYKCIENKNQVVMISEKYKKWFRANKTSKDILMILDGKTSLKDIARIISDDYDITIEQLEDDVVKFCQSALSAGYIVTKDKIEELNDIEDNTIKSIFIDVTNNCNLNCIYCNKCVSNNDEVTNIDEKLLFSYINRLIEEKKIISSTINITGGEPLLHPKIKDILEFFKGKTFPCILWTNGYYLNETNIEWIKNSCQYVVLSLDSHIKETNDNLRGRNAYENVLRSVDLLKKKEIEFIIASTPTKYNLNHLDEILILSEKLGANSLIINDPIKIDYNSNTIEDCFDYTNCEYEEAYTKILKSVSIMKSWKNYASNKKPINVASLRDTCLNNIYYIKPKLSCGAGINEISISSNGYVYPCHMLNISGFDIDNINNDYNEIDLGYNPITIHDMENCRDCEINFVCLGGCRAEAYYNSGDVYYERDNCKSYKETSMKYLFNIID